MEHTISRIRYWLEIIALPAFIFLVIHLSGHGVGLLKDGAEHSHEHRSSGSHFADILENIFNLEVLVGVLSLILFAWIWHRPSFSKWVPCRHDHCHAENQMPHLLAIFAFCLHFFPEASVRHALINQAMAGEVSSIVGLVAFGAHFLVDILVMILLSLYWEGLNKKILSFVFIIGIWFCAFFFGEYISLELVPLAKGGMFLLSAFLLSMFVHLPHKSNKSCVGCSH